MKKWNTATIINSFGGPVKAAALFAEAGYDIPVSRIRGWVKRDAITAEGLLASLDCVDPEFDPRDWLDTVGEDEPELEDIF